MDLHLTKGDFSPTIKSAPARHTLFEVILLLIIIGLFYWFIIIPKQSSLETLNNQYDKLNLEQGTLQENKDRLTKAIADMQSHPQEVAYMDEALPLDNRVTKLYIVLENLTQYSGMKAGDINIAFPNQNDMAGNKAQLENPFVVSRSLQKLTTTLNVTGTFDQFQALLQKIEDSGRLINIKAINIVATKENLLDFNINLEAYYYE
jgi:Tfp pilus assembly protein PilO